MARYARVNHKRITIRLYGQPPPQSLFKRYHDPFSWLLEGIR
jgi:hypothetical protein